MEDIVPYIEVSYDDGIHIIESLDLMINLLNQRIGYLDNNLLCIKYRINELKKHTGNITDAIKLFNLEKDNTKTKYNKIKLWYSDFINYYVNNLITYLEPLEGSSFRTNMGKIKIGAIRYIYKLHDTLNITSFDNTGTILKLYDFIRNCNDVYFHEQFEHYSVEIVRIPKIIIYTKTSIGYVMDFVVGTTVRDLITNHNEYWISNKDLIKKAIYKLIDKLTKKKVLIIDFAYDNIMWNMITHRLTYIDIQINAFNRDAELELNNDVKWNVEMEKIQ